MNFVLHRYPSYSYLEKVEVDYSSLRSSILFCTFSVITLAVSHGSLKQNFTRLAS